MKQDAPTSTETFLLTATYNSVAYSKLYTISKSTAGAAGTDAIILTINLTANVVATANDVTNLPPELLRKGRFDEIFFVDLPNINERKKIFEIHITKRNRKTEFYDIELLSEKSNNFTGAEIESAIEAAMYDAFSENKREFTTTDILMAMSQSVPIAKLMDNEIRYLREWANNRARNASNLPLIVNSVDEDL